MTKKKTPADKLRDSLKTITSEKGDNVVDIAEARAAREGNEWDIDEEDGPPDLVELRLTRNQITSTLAGIDPNDNRNKAKVAGALRHMFAKQLDTGRVFFRAWLASEDEITAEQGVDLYDKLTNDCPHPAHWRSLVKAAKGCDQVDAMSRLDSASFVNLELIEGLPEAFQCQVLGRGKINFPATTQKGAIKTANWQNAHAVYNYYGLDHRFNLFARRTYVNGKTIQDADIYSAVDTAHKHAFDASAQTMRGCAYARAHKDEYHPVLDHLAALPAWDKVKRLDRFAAYYLGAANTRLHSALGVLMFMSIIRRVKQPGYKCDNLYVLYGPQDIGKSLALRIMALDDEWFCDGVEAGMQAKEVAELTAGKLIVEVAEMVGQGRRDTETVKTFVSRQSDDARKSYGYERADAPRQFTLFGSTNKPRFLLDDTGNRRFPTIDCGAIKHDDLRRDIEQLYAEALMREPKFGWLELPADLKAAAREQAEAKRLISSVEEDASDILTRFYFGKIEPRDLRSYLGLKSPIAQTHLETVGKVARDKGWTRKQLRKPGAGQVWCYAKGSAEQLAGDGSWIELRGKGTPDYPCELFYRQI